MTDKNQTDTLLEDGNKPLIVEIAETIRNGLPSTILSPDDSFEVYIKDGFVNCDNLAEACIDIIEKRESERVVEKYVGNLSISFLRHGLETGEHSKEDMLRELKLLKLVLDEALTKRGEG